MVKYIVDLKLYNKITLVGFDNYQLGKSVYYYDPKEYNKKLLYLLGKDKWNKKGISIGKNEHSPEKSREYLKNLRKNYPDIEFNFITDDKELI